MIIALLLVVIALLVVVILSLYCVYWQVQNSVRALIRISDQLDQTDGVIRTAANLPPRTVLYEWEKPADFGKP